MTTTTTPAALTAGQRCAADIATLLRARNPLLIIQTREEARTERYIMDSAQIAGYEPRFWDCANGITDYTGQPREQGASCTDPAQVIKAIGDSTRRQLWILRDLPTWLRDPTVNRALRSLARSLTLAPRDEARAVIMLTAAGEIPPEIQAHSVAMDFPLPDRAEIASLLDSALAALPDDIKAQAAPNGTRDAAIDAAIGLTEEKAQGCFAKSLVSLRKLDPATISAEKERIIAEEKILEWVKPIKGGMDAVGGLEGLKPWLKQRRAAFGARARAYGLPTPKGVLLAGVPGCGKSLTAKAIAAAWGLPLLRMDMGSLKSKFVGESEGNLRRALKIVETIAPAVLWIDEIEKALAGATAGGQDGGTSVDQLGTLLTWQQERTSPVFLVATANDCSSLPPELMRRFDAIFFVDLPNQGERAAVLRAALAQHGLSPSTPHNLGIDDLAAATQEFTGAEIAAIVPEAMYAAFADAERSITTQDLLTAIAATVPLARTTPEKIDKLRAWAKGRARPASIAQSTTTTTTGAGRALDI